MDKRKKIITAVVVLVVLFASYKMILAKPLQKMGQLRQELRIVQKEIDAYSSMTADKGVVKNESAPVEKLPSLLSEQDVPFVLERFFKEVAGDGQTIRFKLIQPGIVEPEGKYRKLPIAMRFNGTFDDVAALLDRVEHLSLVARTDLIEVRQGSTPGMISGHVVASVLLLPGGPVALPAPGAVTPPVLSWMEVSDPFDRSQPAVNLSGGGSSYAPVLQELELSGIWFGSKPRAVINNTVAGEGMTVSGYRVQKIYKDKVVLSRNGQQRTLTVRGGESHE